MQSDPLRAHADLSLRARFYPLGFPLEVATDAPAVITALRESWGEFKQNFERPAVRLSLGIMDGTNNEQSLSPPVYRSREHLLTISSDSDNFITCDLANGFGFGWLTPQVIANSQFARFYFLDAAALAMIDQLYLAPVHSALIAREGRGILLCGDTCAGKSTLAYACARSGWTLVCDDGAFLVRGRMDRYAIGNSEHIRLRPDAKQFFPELALMLASSRPNGKIALELATRKLAIETASGAVVTHVVLLNRFAGCPAHLAPISPEAALTHLKSVTSYGSLAMRQAREKEYARLLECGLFRLEYACLESAISCLEELLQN